MDNSTPIRTALMEMQVEDTIEFPIERLRSVRTMASELGLIYTRKFTTKTDRVNKIIEVTREA